MKLDLNLENNVFRFSGCSATNGGTGEVTRRTVPADDDVHGSAKFSEE